MTKRPTFEPTDEQIAFIKAPPRAVLIACPGSGKTETCARRFVLRGTNAPTRGIAYLSYTNAAVNAARERLQKLGGAALLSPPHFVGTIDAFWQRFLFQPFIGIVVPGVPIDSIEVFGGGSADTAPPHISQGPTYCFYNGTHSGARSWQVRLRRMNGEFGLYERAANVPLTIEASKACVEKKRQYLCAGFASHNDVLYWCFKIIDKCPHALDILASRFSEIIVDEAQDTSPIQHRLFERLECCGVDLAFVGDPDQSIYQFNDAAPTFIRERYASAGKNAFSLTYNFRASRQIVAAINAFANRKMAGVFDAPDPLGAFVTVIPRKDSVDCFRDILERRGIELANGALLLRDADGVQELVGGPTIDAMNTGVKRLITAMRLDRRGEYAAAADACSGFLQTVLSEDASSRPDRDASRVAAWHFLRKYLPWPDAEAVGDWLNAVKDAVKRFASDRGLKVGNLSGKISMRGVPKLSAVEVVGLRAKPSVPVRTVHDAKGESIGAVMLHGKDRQHKKWLDGKDDEMRCLGYVAMTRAERLLVIACETEDVAEGWRQLGFVRL